MDKIELTEEELQAKIDEAVNKAKADTETELKKKHDSEMAQLRIKEKEEREKAIKKAQEDANMSAEEKAKKEYEEQRKAEQAELEQLRLEKKINDRSNKLKEKGLPEFFKNDSRLLNAEDDKVDEVIETIKGEYEKVLPNGATIDTNVKGGNGNQQKEDEFKDFRSVGNQRRK